MVVWEAVEQAVALTQLSRLAIAVPLSFAAHAAATARHYHLRPPHPPYRQSWKAGKARRRVEGLNRQLSGLYHGLYAQLALHCLPLRPVLCGRLAIVGVCGG